MLEIRLDTEIIHLCAYEDKRRQFIIGEIGGDLYRKVTKRQKVSLKKRAEDFGSPALSYIQDD
jgi:hypothetical protein